VQLLVSVADAVEARRAVDGGADIIDAKDPLSGALGAVSLATLEQIYSVVSGRRMVTAALGDASNEASIEQLAFEYARVGVGFVKIGFAGITDVGQVERLLVATVKGTRATGLRCGVVAVAYADTGAATSVDPTALIDVAARAGATGVLFDTAIKSGPGLRQLLAPRALDAWVTRAQRARLTVALAGKLTRDDLPFIAETGADIAGVRGAACATGRTSQIAEDSVRALKAHAGRGLTV
jgi:uncharacterized protein (UPF0264 family)